MSLFYTGIIINAINVVNLVLILMYERRVKMASEELEFIVSEMRKRRGP